MSMRIAVVQMRPDFGDVEGNARKALSMVRSERADVYVLPELALSGYLFESKEEAKGLAQAPGHEVFEAFAETAQTAGATVIIGFAERGDEGLYNSSLLLGPGGERRVYRKVQLFWGEKDVFEPGDRPPAVVESSGVRLGMMICFDWIFPEVARTLALAGAQVLCHSTNLVLPYCQDAMVTRCIENRVFAAVANRVGTESRAGKELRFTGMSEIVAPDGEVLLRAGPEEETVLVAEIDPGRADDKSVTPKNDLFGDRRPKLYRL
jgi:predicted amidohydrolase